MWLRISSGQVMHFASYAVCAMVAVFVSFHIFWPCSPLKSRFECVTQEQLAWQCVFVACWAPYLLMCIHSLIHAEQYPLLLIFWFLHIYLFIAFKLNSVRGAKCIMGLNIESISFRHSQAVHPLLNKDATQNGSQCSSPTAV